ncbi:MAG: hypothetical protein ACTSX7_15800 [Alphaproteobacteria bacterium]
MPHEHRQIIFTPEELSKAVAAHNRVADPPLIHGTYCSCWIDGDEVKVMSEISDGSGIQELVVTLPKKFVLASLIRFCVESNIMLPRAGKKAFMFLGGRACIEIVLQPEGH